MKLKRTQLEARDVLVKRAKSLYKQDVDGRPGYSTRDIGRLIGRSHTWVAGAINGELTQRKQRLEQKANN